MPRNATPILAPQDPHVDMEAWRNTARGTVGIWHYAGAYGETRMELVPGGGTFHLTPAERRLNQEKALNAQVCAFRNGTVVPVRTEAVDDTDEVRSNPAALTDEEVAELVRGHHKTLGRALRDITNPVTLARLLDAARVEEVTLGKINAIEARLVEVAPTPAPVTEVADVETPPAADAPPEPEAADIYDDAAFGQPVT